MAAQVTVGCRLPAGLVLRLYRQEKYVEQVAGNVGAVRNAERAVPMAERGEVRLNGSARFVGKDQLHDIRSGVGLTHGVDAEFFAEWSKQFPDFTTCETPLVFAQTRASEATAQARDMKSVKTGFEPLDPDNLPAEFSRTIQTAARN